MTDICNELLPTTGNPCYIMPCNLPAGHDGEHAHIIPGFADRYVQLPTTQEDTCDS